MKRILAWAGLVALVVAPVALVWWRWPLLASVAGGLAGVERWIVVAVAVIAAVAWLVVVWSVVVEAVHAGSKWRIPWFSTGVRSVLAVSAGAVVAPTMAIATAQADEGAPDVVDAEADEATAAALEGAGTYTVQTGDDLWSIAEAAYGDGMAWNRIFQANRDVISDPDELRIGWVLTLPGTTHAPTQTVTIEADDAEHGHTDDEDARPPEARRAEPDGAGRIPDTDASADADPSPTRAASSPEPAVDDDPALPHATGTPEAAPNRNGDAPTTPERPAAEATDAARDVAPTLAVGALLAGAALIGLGAHRLRQQVATDVGRRPRHAPESARHLESTLVASDGRRRARRLWSSHARLGSHVRATDHLPAVAHAAVGDSGVRWTFVEPPGRPPSGWSATTAAWHDPADDDRVDGPLPFPGLVPVGVRDGHDILVDVTAAGTVSVRGTHAAQTVVAIAAAAALGTAGEPCRVVCVGHRDLIRSLAVPDVESVDDVETAVQRATPPRRAALPTDRLNPDLAPELAPTILAVPSRAPGTEHLLAKAAERGITVVAADLPSADAIFDADTGTWRHGDAILAGITPIRLDSVTEEALAALHRGATTDDTEPAPWWPDSPRPHARQEIPVTMLGHDHPAVLMLGPIELVGAQGEAPTRARAQCTEYAAWLLEHPGGSATRMARSLVVAESTRRSNLSRLRTWLGHSGNDEPYLPQARSGQILLHPRVGSDWQRFQTLVAAGVNHASADALEAALSLVRGQPLEDALPGQWGWAEPLRSDMLLAVRDASVELARRALDDGDVDRARWATNQGMSACPWDEVIVCSRIRVESVAGNPSEADRLARLLAHQSRSLGVDLRPDTFATLRSASPWRATA